MPTKQSALLILALLSLLITPACQGTRAKPPVSEAPPSTQDLSSTSVHTLSSPIPSRTPFHPLPTATSAPTATQIPVCLEKAGQLRTETLNTTGLSQALTVIVYLPACLTQPPESGHPLLVLLHGQTYYPNHWLLLGLAETADRLINDGAIPPMIILMPQEDYYLQDPEQSLFDTLVMETLLPWAQEELAACNKADCRAVGGISRGGSWALRLAMDYPEFFSVVGMHSSPPFTYDANRLILSLIHVSAEERPHLLIDVGDYDMYRNYIVQFHDDLVKQEIEHTFTGAPGGHDDAYWQAHMEEYLRWYGSLLESPH